MKAQLISKATQTRQFTPKVLLQKVKSKGCFPNFIYNKAEDKMLCQLNILAQRYRQSLSIDDKAELLKHERDMLYEEIQAPELTLARYYPQIKQMGLSKQNKKNIEDYLTLCNLNAIARINSLDKPFEATLTKDEENILVSSSERINESSPIKEELIEGFNRALSYYGTSLDDIDYSENIPETLNKLDKDINQPELLKNLLLNADFSKEEKIQLKNLVNKILCSKNPNPESLRYAVWAAGKYRSDEAFSKIKKIALDKDEKDIRKREFAIHSVAKYLRTKFNEVDSIMESIKKEDSLFSPLANIIKDKINGKYYTKIDRELNYYRLKEKDKQNFKRLRDSFYILEKGPSIKQKNALDRNLIPFIQILDFLVKNEFKYYIQEDTYTKIETEFVGKREFGRGLLNSGDFEDACDGISHFHKRYNMMNIGRIEEIDQNNVIAHENGHTYHNLLPIEYQEYILDLYHSAIEKDIALDYYAATSEREYIAQGFEAFASIYKPHKILLDEHPYSNTRYKLFAQDPDLFNLIYKLVVNND